MNDGILSNLSSFKKFQKDTTLEFIEKRRKLSKPSLSTDSGNSDLNDKFLKLELNNSQDLIVNLDKFTTSSGSQNSCSPPHLIHIPKPVKVSPQSQNLIINEVNHSNFSLNEAQNLNNQFNPFKTLMFEQLGISKYLNLERDQNAADLLRKPQQILEQIQKNMMSEKQPKQNPCYYVYGVPANFDFLLKSSTALLKSQINESDKRVKDYPSSRIGKLTREQRAEKVRIYLEKKHSRSWNTIKYTARQKLADQRKRVNGKFVRQPKLINLIAKSESQPYISISELDSRLTQSWECNPDWKDLKDQRKQNLIIFQNSYQMD